MATILQCEGCGQRYSVPSQRPNSTVTCKKCGRVVRVPHAPPVVSPPPIAAPVRRAIVGLPGKIHPSVGVDSPPRSWSNWWNRLSSDKRFFARLFVRAALAFFIGALAVVAFLIGLNWNHEMRKDIAQRADHSNLDNSLDPSQDARSLVDTDKNSANSKLAASSIKTPKTPLSQKSQTGDEWWKDIKDPIVGHVGDANSETRATKEGDLQRLIASIEPSVVTVNVTRVDGNWSGSGFVIDKADQIATNFHVIEGAKSATVVFPDGTFSKVIGYCLAAAGKDIVVLKIDHVPKVLLPLTLAKTTPAKGSKVVAIGSPLGTLSGSATDGIVSSVRPGSEVRDALINEEFDVYSDYYNYDLNTTWIQTSVPISHGNSGGPLVNVSGEVVGLNTLSLVNKGQNLNFAISAFELRVLLDVTDGHVKSLSQLPKSRKAEVIAAAKERQRKETDEQAVREKKKQEDIVQAIRESDRKAKIRNDLLRMSNEITSLRQELADIERQGVTLTARRSEVLAAGPVLDSEGQQVLSRISEIEAEGPNLSPASQSLALSELRLLKDRYNRLKAKYFALDSEGKSLLTEVEYLTKKRDDKTSDLRLLEAKYKSLEMSAR